MAVAKIAHSLAVAGLAAVLCAAVLGPQIAPYDPNAVIPPMSESHAGAPHWLGVDGLQRDVLSRLLWGARSSLGEALAALVIAVAIGGSMGLAAFLSRTGVERVISHTFDLMQVFPSLLLAMTLLAAFGPGPTNIAAAVGLSLCAQVGRVVQRAVSVAGRQGYVEASFALGANRLWVIWRHLVRNISRPLAALVTITFAWALVSTVTLDFLGLSGDISTPTWGNMISEGRLTLREAPMAVAAPMIGILLSVGSLAVISDAWASRHSSRHP